jgi:predicted phage terminase large subunit-like protein
MLQFGLRLGDHPRTIITTTPKPIPLVRSILKGESDGSTIVTRGSTYDNKANLAKSFFRQIAKYEGTKLGDQELHAALLDPSEAGIIKESWLQKWPAKSKLPRFDFILQSYDTAYTEKTFDKKTKDRDPTAQTTWGIFMHPAYKYYCALLLDAWEDQLGYPDLRKKVLDEFNTSRYGEQNHEINLVLIEEKGSGISLRQDLQRRIKIVPYNPGKDDKMARLHAVSHLPARGRVYVPESPTKPGTFIDWSLPFIEQVTCFPEVVHDDYTDTFSQAMAYCRDLGYLTIDDEELDDEEVDYSRKDNVNPYSQ